MPRDKKLSHQRVLEAAKKEFYEDSRIFYTGMDANNGIIKEPQGSFLIC